MLLPLVRLGLLPVAGDLLSIASALFFAMQIFRTEKTSRLLPEGSNLPYMSIILATVAAVSCACTAAVHWQDAAAALASLQVVWDRALDGLGPSDTPISAARPMFDLVYTSFCSTDLVLLIELVALQTVSSTEAALIYSLEPVSGRQAGWLAGWLEVCCKSTAVPSVPCLVWLHVARCKGQQPRVVQSSVLNPIGADRDWLPALSRVCC